MNDDEATFVLDFLYLMSKNYNETKEDEILEPYQDFELLKEYTKPRANAVFKQSDTELLRF